MSDEFTPTLSDLTQCLPRELYGDQTRKACHSDDSNLRAARVEVYSKRLMNGLDIWTGDPLDEACEEATRMLGLESRSKCGGRRPQNQNGKVKAA